MTDGEWKKGKRGATMIEVIVVDDERFVRMGIVGETDWASLGCEVVGEAENGFRIRAGISDVETIGIDTPEDLAKAEEFLKLKTKN